MFYEGKTLKEAKKDVDSFWSYLYQKEEKFDWRKTASGEIVTADNIDDFIPKITPDKAEGMLQQITAIDKAKGSWNEYFKELQNNNQGCIVDLIKNTDDLSKLTGDDLVKANQNARQAAIAHNTALKQQTLGAKAAKFAMSALVTVGNTLLGMGISYAFGAITNALNKSKQEHEEYVEHLREVADKLSDEAGKSHEAAQGLAELKQALDDGTKGAGALNYAFEEQLKAMGYTETEIDKLVEKYGGLADAINGVTKSTWEKAKSDAFASQIASARVARESADEAGLYNPFSEVLGDSIPWLDGNLEYLSVWASENNEAKKILEEYGAPDLTTDEGFYSAYLLARSYVDQAHKYVQDMETTIDDSWLGEYSKNKKDYSWFIDPKQNGMYKWASELIGATNGQMGEYESAEKIINQAEAYYEFSEDIENTTIDSQEDYDSYIESVKNSTEYTDKLKDEIIGFAKNAFPKFSGKAEDAGESTEEVSDSMKTLTERIEEVSNAYNTLNSAQKEIESNGKLSLDTISKIAEKYPELEDEMYEYMMGMRDEASILELLKTKANETTTLTMDAFKRMYFSTNTVSKDMAEDFENAFSIIGLEWDNTQSIMANINNQIIDANGLVTTEFTNQWADACKRAGISVQSFANGLYSLLVGDLYNPDTKTGVYVKDGIVYNAEVDGTQTKLANTIAEEIKYDLVVNKEKSKYWERYSKYTFESGAYDEEAIIAAVNEDFANQVEAKYKSNTEIERRRKETDERLKNLGKNTSSSSSSSIDYSDFWDEYLEGRKIEIEDIDSKIDRANTRLDHAIRTGNAEQIQVLTKNLQDLNKKKREILEYHATAGREDLAIIMKRIYEMVPELEGKNINEITPYEIEFYSQSFEGNNYLQDEWDSITKSAQSYYETISGWSDEWWQTEKDRLEQTESYYDTALDAIDRYKERIEYNRQQEIDTLDDLITKENALLGIKESQFEASKNLKDAQKEIDKEIQNSRDSKQYLSKDEYERIFNEEDYTKLSKGIKRIGNEINSLTDDFYKQVEDAYANGQLYLVETITAEYERQLAMKERELEIAKANVDLEKKRLNLENILAEKNIKQYGENGITWVADQEKVKQAREDLIDAEAEYERLKEENAQQMLLDQRKANIDMLEAQKASLEHQLELLDKSIEKLKMAIEDITDPFVDLSVLLEELLNDPDKNISNAAKEVSSGLNRQGVSTGKSSGGGGSSGGGSSGQAGNSNATATIPGFGDVGVNIDENGNTTTTGLPVGTVVHAPDGNDYKITGVTGDANDNYTSVKIDKKPYDSGGIASGKGLMLKDVDEEETVLPPWLTKQVLTPEYNENFSKLLENMQMVSLFNPSNFVVKPQTDSLLMKNINQPTSITKTWNGNMYVDGGDPNEILKALDQAFDRATI